jgi:hypothetical protein
MVAFLISIVVKASQQAEALADAETSLQPRTGEAMIAL